MENLNDVNFEFTDGSKTSLGERKLRSALINTLLQLNEDKKYDIAVSLAADIGYKLVQVNDRTNS